MTKQCFKCKKTFSTDMFYLGKNNKFYSYCKKCDVQRKIIWQRKNKDKGKKINLDYVNRGDNFIKITIKGIFKHSRMFPKSYTNYERKGWVPEITLKEMYEELLLHIQLMKDKFPNTNGRLCRYCEQPWTTIRKGSKKEGVVKSNFSVDRFDTNKTYMKGNIIFCCSRCNMLKNASTKKMWIKFLEIDKELHEENKTR